MGIWMGMSAAARPAEHMTDRHPAFWPTIFVIPALALLIGLGVWQIHKLDLKTELLARIEAAMSAEPAVLPETISDPEDWDYRRIRVEGVFLHEHEFHLAGRRYRGQVGLQVVTPLRRTDLAAGQVVLVNRGWVPPDRTDRTTRLEGQPAGVVTVSGIARRPPERGWMQPDNEPDANVWFWVDPPAMAAAAGASSTSGLILEADVVADSSALPIGGQTRLDIPNNHLQYAVTWFAFAVTLAVIYLLYLRGLARPPANLSNGPEPT